MGATISLTCALSVLYSEGYLFECGEGLASMRRLFKQLKRRNVLRAAGGYAVVAWLLIQVADILFPILGVPTWVTTMVVILIVIGFPVTVIVSWIYQWTPAGIMTEQEADAAGHTQPIGIGRQFDYVIIVLLIIAVSWLAYEKTIVAPALDNSIAVLPFANMSDDPDNEYFSDGMSEEILNLLAKMPGLKVIGRTSSFAFKGRNEDLRVIGQTLGVSTVLEGSVRTSGDQVRITAQLIDVSNGAHIWSETYNRTLSDIFAVQDSVAAAIIDALQIHVGTLPSRGRPTESPAAYALFLKSRAAVNVFEWREAESLLLQATELDSNFAEAYELLAYAYWGLTPWAIEAVEAQELTSEAAAKAIAIDSELVLANALHQAAIFGPNIRSRKLAAFESAARKQPDNPWILDLLVFSLAENGYLAESLRMAERYVELDPLSLTAIAYLPLALHAVGRTEDAIASMEIVNRSNTSPNFMTWSIDGINLVEHRDAAAIAQFELHARQNGSDSSWIREMVNEARDPVSGQAHLDRYRTQFLSLMSEADVVSMYLFFGFLDRYFELIFASEPSPSTWHAAGLHLWRGNIFHRTGFTAHPRYVELARSLGIVESWEQRGPPDFCEKVDGQWVCE
jgi:TolB-like protein